MDANDTPVTGPLSVEDYVKQQAAPQEDTPTPTDEVPQEEQTEEVEAQADAEEVETEEVEAPEEVEETQILTEDYDDLIVQVGDEQLSLADLKKGQLRQADYTRKSQALAEERKQFEQERQQLDARQQELQQQADASFQTEGRPPDLTPAEISELYATNEPGKAAELIALYENAQKQWDTKQAEITARNAQQRQEFTQKTIQTLFTKFPDYQDASVLEKVTPEFKAIAGEFNVSEQEFMSNPDMRLTALVAEVHSLRSRLSRKQTNVEKKVSKAPRVLKPANKVTPEAEKAKAIAAVKQKYSGPLNPRQYAEREAELAALK